MWFSMLGLWVVSLCDCSVMWVVLLVCCILPLLSEVLTIVTMKWGLSWCVPSSTASETLSSKYGKSVLQNVISNPRPPFLNSYRSDECAFVTPALTFAFILTVSANRTMGTKSLSQWGARAPHGNHMDAVKIKGSILPECPPPISLALPPSPCIVVCMIIGCGEILRIYDFIKRPKLTRHQPTLGS